MARKSRYLGYYKGVMEMKKKVVSTPKSILGRLKSLKDQEFVMQVPVGGSHEA